MISILVPVLNEARVMPELLQHLLALDGDKQILVIDGGSTDETRDVARHCPPVRLLSALRGRGRQIQTGAEAARGRILLALHADCRLPRDALSQIETVCANGTSWGWFDLRYDSPCTSLRVVERLLNLRSRIWADPTGENAVFATREAWNEAGGCPQEPLMEDFLLARRLRRVGRGTALRAPVLCSARRYEFWGVANMCVRCILLWLAFRLGAPPSALARFYPHVRTGSPEARRAPSTGAQPAEPVTRNARLTY